MYIKNVITHAPVSHMDDILSVAMLLYHYKNIRLHRIKHDQVEEYREKYPDAIWVDIGGIYDPKQMKFDHHQDESLDPSFIIVAKWLNIGLSGDLVEYFAIKDIKGPKVAEKYLFPQLHIKKDLAKTVLEIESVIKYITDKWWDLLPDSDKKEGVCISSTDNASPYSSIMLETYYNYNNHTITWSIGMDKMIDILYNLINHFPNFYNNYVKDKEEKETIRKTLRNTAKSIEIDGYRFLVFNNTGMKTSLDLEEEGVDGLICINQRSNKPQIIVDTTKGINAGDIAKTLGLNTEFVHNNGFLAILSDDWETIENSL